MKLEPGLKLGRLIAVEFSHKNKSGQLYWKFKCICGNETVTRKSQVINGQTRSCGCLRKDSWRKKN